MSQRIEVTRAVAVTVTAPADADAVAGPYVVSPWRTHSHIGTPTVYQPSRRGEALRSPDHGPHHRRSQLCAGHCAAERAAIAQPHPRQDHQLHSARPPIAEHPHASASSGPLLSPTRCWANWRVQAGIAAHAGTLGGEGQEI